PAVRGLRGHRRHHLYLRRHPGQHQRRSGGRVGPSHPGAVRHRRDHRRLLLHELPRRRGPDAGCGVWPHRRRQRSGFCPRLNRARRTSELETREGTRAGAWSLPFFNGKNGKERLRMLGKPKGAKELRQLLAGDAIVVAPGVFDGLSAKIAEAAGFPALYVSGGAISRGMGYPDIGLVTFTEMVKRLEEIRAVTTVPLVVDADTGYGNAINVIRTVRAYEQAGAAALHLEDQVAPKRCGHYEGKEVVSRHEMVQKIRAAVD